MPEVQEERRQAARSRASVPITVVIAEAQELQGHTVNWSTSGVLVQASGPIRLSVTIKGKAYRGRLVRGVPREDASTQWAIELETPISGSERPED